MLTQKSLGLSLVALCCYFQLLSQEYSVSSPFYPGIVGTYRPFTSTDGVNNYKNTAANIYLFRSAGLWIFSDQPDLTGMLIDFETSNSPTPPVGTWQSTTVVDLLLPVEWSYFRASTQTKGVSLEWETLTESNNSGFSVERSLDGIQFASIAWVEGKGSTQEASAYQFWDQELPETPLVYYRLKQVDFDGSYDYSELVSVQHQALRSFSVYPTVLSKDQAKLQIRGGEQFESLYVVDAKGRLLFSRKMGPEWQKQLDLSALSAGQYHLVGNKGTLLQSLPFFIINR
ncbi:MAG: hypothetical protein KTR30_19340 [Saprospiraceae bacterium]|nr:hypothetical protein [Saprospiraceae bacterium]